LICAWNIFYSTDVAPAVFQDVPEDPTGELDKVQKFVVDNLDICKWVALGVVFLEVSASTLSLDIVPSQCLLSYSFKFLILGPF